MDDGRLHVQRKPSHARGEKTINRAKIGYGEKEDGKDKIDCQCGWLQSVESSEFGNQQNQTCADGCVWLHLHMLASMLKMKHAHKPSHTHTFCNLARSVRNSTSVTTIVICKNNRHLLCFEFTWMILVILQLSLRVGSLVLALDLSRLCVAARSLGIYRLRSPTSEVPARIMCARTLDWCPLVYKL